MQFPNNSERIKLDQIVSDDSVPKQLQRDLRSSLKTLDTLTSISQDANRSCRDLLEARDEYRRSEPSRIVDAVLAGEPLSVEEVLSEFPVYEANHALAVQRAAALRRAVLMQQQATSAKVFLSHSVEILTATAEAVVSGEPVSAGLNECWSRVEGRFRWEMPQVHRGYRFTKLLADRPSQLMKKCWQSVLEGQFVNRELAAGFMEIRFTDYWPEFSEMAS